MVRSRSYRRRSVEHVARIRQLFGKTALSALALAFGYLVTETYPTSGSISTAGTWFDPRLFFAVIGLGMVASAAVSLQAKVRERQERTTDI